MQYACKTWFTSKEDNIRRIIWERKILKNKNMDQYIIMIAQKYGKKIMKLHDLYEKHNIFTYVIWKYLKWLGYVWRIDKDILNNFFYRKNNRKRLFGRLARTRISK